MIDDDAREVRLRAHADEPRLGILQISRPPLNAFSQGMWDQFAEVTETLSRHPRFRAVVITGGPENFAAGADVKDMLRLDAQEFHARNLILQHAFHTLAQAPQISIAAVNGYALGGGCELALAADFRIAGQSTVFGLPEVTLGIMPGSGGTQRLGRLIGISRAKDLILTGRFVRSADALRFGLVDRVVSDDQVFELAVEQAMTFARGPYSLRLAKRAIDESYDLPIDDGLRREADLITESFASEDGQHGLRSFVEHGPRKATFLGR